MLSCFEDSTYICVIASKTDERNISNNIGQYRLATAVTTTVLLASVGSSSQRGLTLKQLKLCLLKPDAFQHIEMDSTLREYLACNRILTEYSSQLDSEQRKDVSERKRTYEQAARELLPHAYSTVAKCAGDEIETYSVTNFASEMSVQITTNILAELREEGKVLNSIGMGVINRHGLMPTVDNPVSLKDFYEAFLRFDDKPMILGENTVVNTVNTLLDRNLWKVGIGDKGHYTRIYTSDDGSVPFLNPQDESCWLLDPSVSIPGAGSTGGDDGGEGRPASASGSSAAGDSGDSGDGCDGSPDNGTGAATKTYRKVTIEGTVPMENYHQLFQSFIQTLRYNHLKIEMRFSAESTAQSPLADNASVVKSIRESASQLGLDISFEQ